MQNFSSSEQMALLSDSGEEVVVPTRVDIKLPFAPEGETMPPGKSFDSDPGSQNPTKQFIVESGTVIGEYVIEEKIGQGGMGEIWKGSQPLIGKQVAIKFLRGKMASDSDSIERFIREAKAVNSIKHKTLIDIFSFGDLPDGRPYFVMEYLQGQNLLSYIAENGPLPWSEILEIFGQLCEGLEATHQQGIIHRDLKSENLFLLKTPGKPFVVKVLDFGLAKLMDADQENAQLTQAGVVFGTPAYMAPEQCKGNVSHLSDIYSLGIILFETITGRTPFFEPGLSAAEVMLRHVGDPASAPSALVEGRVVPKEVDALVLQILSKAPDKRPSSCRELGAYIQEVIGPLVKEDDAQEPGSAKPVFLPESKRWSIATPKRTSRRFVAMGAFAILATAFAAYQTLKLTKPLPASPPANTQTQVVEAIQTAPALTHPEKIMLRLKSTPEKAQVFLEGKLLGVTSLEKEIPYGEKELELTFIKDGYQKYTEKFIPDTGVQYNVPLQPIGSKIKTTAIKTPENPKETPVVKTNKLPEDKNATAPNPFQVKDPDKEPPNKKKP
jgi:serine/threonine protein kinase